MLAFASAGSSSIFTDVVAVNWDHAFAAARLHPGGDTQSQARDENSEREKQSEDTDQSERAG